MRKNKLAGVVEALVAGCLAVTPRGARPAQPIPIYVSGAQARAADRVSQAGGLAIGPQGLLLLDSCNSRVLVLADTGAVRGEVAGGAGAPTFPCSGLSGRMVVASDGKLYIADPRALARLLVFQPSGRFVRQIPLPMGIEDFAVAKDGKIFVVPNFAQGIDARVVELDRTGTVLRKIGRIRDKEFGGDAGDANDALICLVDDTSILVADQHFPVLRLYSSDGKLLWQRTYALPAYITSTFGAQLLDRDYVERHPDAPLTLASLVFDLKTVGGEPVLLINGNRLLYFTRSGRLRRALSLAAGPHEIISRFAWKPDRADLFVLEQTSRGSSVAVVHATGVVNAVTR